VIAVGGLRLPVIDSEWTGDRQDAGHHQNGLDPGGDAPEGLEVHAARVPGRWRHPRARHAPYASGQTRLRMPWPAGGRGCRPDRATRRRRASPTRSSGSWRRPGTTSSGVAVPVCPGAAGLPCNGPPRCMRRFRTVGTRTLPRHAPVPEVGEVVWSTGLVVSIGSTGAAPAMSRAAGRPAGLAARPGSQWDHVPPLELPASRGMLLCELVSRPGR
jgi:hypothetical protein